MFISLQFKHGDFFLVQMDEYIKFWAKYTDITRRVKRKYIFRRTPFEEAKELYAQLLIDSRRKPFEYQAHCAMAMAR